MQRMHWQDWGSLVLGIWLLVSPWVIGFSGNEAATWNAILFGLGAIALELADVYFPDPWPERGAALIGVWVAISPLLLGFTADFAALLSTSITGAVLFVLSTAAYWSESHKPAGSH